jgi:hypothetical protein
MAAVVNYGDSVDPTIGRYGLYNPFLIRITRTGGTVFKLKYRINIQVVGTTIDITKDVDPINGVSIVNPVEPLKGQFFETQLIGNNGVGQVPLDSSGGNADKSYNKVRIRVGEVSSTSADLPATFGGYTDDRTLYFYNGFDNIPSAELYSNYRPTNTYEPLYSIPLVNKNVKLLDNDIAFLSLPSVMSTPLNEEGGGGVVILLRLYYTHYDISGGEIESSNFGLYERYGAYDSQIGYWTIQYGTAQILYPSNWAYSTFYADYVDAENNYTNTESFNVYKQECDPKYDRYRLRWFNKYSGFEYFNFTKKSSQTLNISKGKEVRTSGINFDAANFSSMKYPSVPELREVGKSATTTYTLNSGFINEEEQNALKDMYLSPNIIMFDKDNNITPVILEDSSYEITDIRDGLVKVAVKLRVANNNKVILQ